MRALIAKKAPIYLVATGLLVVLASLIPIVKGLYPVLFSGADTGANINISFLSVLGFCVFGILLFLTGAIQWIRTVAMIPATPANRGSGSDQDHENWGLMSCHIASLFGYVFPFGHIIAPFIVWARRRGTPAINREGITSLNFQITITVFVLISALLSVVFVGIVMLLVVVAFHFAATIYVAVRVKRGGEGRYPVSLTIISLD